MSFDAKVVFGAATFCTFLGIALIVAGVVVYNANATVGGHSCTCPEGEAGDECCHELHSVCDECWCTHFELSEGYCDLYEDTSSHDGPGLGLAIGGLAVCGVSAAMLITMRRCKKWSEKNLHVRYPPVTPLDASSV